ncbi:Myb-like_DNA-binding domain-containing protein [Hexamita inflata]|nr:Myb-like DNA-binding domain-containing protein [Hexamita inflata]CAI9965913.1 Myb-like DNA-binding domain-containing protein [Hexamita inflata]
MKTEYHKWSQQEMQLLMKVANQTNCNWEEIHQVHFAQLTLNQVKNKYYMILKYNHITPAGPKIKASVTQSGSAEMELATLLQDFMYKL